MANDIKTKIELEGGKEYRQQLNQINAEMRTLKAEGNEVASSFDKQDQSEEKLRKTTKNLLDQMEKQREKIELIKKRLEDAEMAYGANDTRTLKLRESLAKANTEYNKMESELKKVNGQMDETSETTSTFGDVLKANLTSEVMLAGVQKLASFLKEAGQALFNVVRDGAGYADEMITMSKNTSLSTDALQEYAYMSELIDVDLNTITGSLAKLTRNMETAKGGTGSAAEAFAQLGVDVTNANGELRNNQDVFADVVEALGQMENTTQRDALAMQIFGRSAQDLNSLIIAGADGMRTYAEEAHEVGYVLDEGTLKSLGSTDDSLQRLNKQWEAAKNTIAMAFAPALEQLATTLTGVVQSIQTFVKEHPEMAKALTALAGAATVLVTAFSAYTILSKITPMVKAFMSAINTSNPYVLALTAVLTVAAAVMPLFAGGLSEAGEKIEDLSAEAKAATDRVEEFNDAMDAKNILEAAGRAGQYIDRLEELEKQGLKTSEAQEEYAQIVKNLNSEFPDLNLSIDETTGLIDQETSAVRKSIGEWEKTATVNQQVKALKTRQEELNKVTSERIRNENSLRAAEEQHTQITTEMEEVQRQYEEAMASGSSEAKALEEQYNELSLELEENETNIDALTESVNKGEEAEASLRKEIDEGTKSIGMSSEELDEYQVSVDGAVTKNGDLTESLDEVGSSAEENFKRFENSLDKVDEVVAVSYDDMIEILESQIKFMEDYESNLSELYSRNVEGLDDMLRELDNGSEESAAWFASMVDQTDEELGNVVATWRKRNGQVKGEAASQGRGAAIALEGAYSRMQESGSYLISGVISGMERKRNTLYSTSASLARVAHQAFNYVAQIKSPSRLFAKSGRYLVEGLEMGIEQETPSLESTLNSLADQAYLAFQMPDLTASGTMQTNNSYDQRVFTPNIVVNAAEGQSAEEVAEMVMDKIQNSYESREAVYA